MNHCAFLLKKWQLCTLVIDFFINCTSNTVHVCVLLFIRISEPINTRERCWHAFARKLPPMISAAHVKTSERPWPTIININQRCSPISIHVWIWCITKIFLAFLLSLLNLSSLAYLHDKGVKDVQFKRFLSDNWKVHVRSPWNYF